MNVKKLYNVAALIGLMLLAACSPKTEYTHALPKDASVVVGLELDEMAEKAGLSGEPGKKVVDKLTALMKSGLKGDASRLAERIINRPSESGLSFDEKVYLFATPHANAFALVAKVEDEGKLETLMDVLRKEQICTPLREESGCRWTQLGQALCAFNNGTFLLMQNSTGDASNIKGTLLSLMRQKEGEGFSALPEFARVQAGGNDIASVVSLSAMPHRLTAQLRMGLSADIRLEDIKYLITANFEPGRVVIDSESLVRNPKVLSFFDTMDKVIQPIEGKFLDFYPANTMLWASGHIKGKELYDMLCQNPTIRQVLANPLLPVDVEYIFSSVEGDFAIGNASMLTGEYLLYADVTNTGFLSTFEDLRPLLALTRGQITLNKTAENQYVLGTYLGNFWFGVKDNRLYVTNSRTLAEEAGRTFGASLGVKPWSANVKENRLYASANLSALTEAMGKYQSLVLTENKQADMVLKVLLDQCDYLVTGMPDWRNARVELVLKDRHTNLLQLIVNTLNNL